MLQIDYCKYKIIAMFLLLRIMRHHCNCNNYRIHIPKFSSYVLLHLSKIHKNKKHIIISIQKFTIINACNNFCLYSIKYAITIKKRSV